MKGGPTGVVAGVEGRGVRFFPVPCDAPTNSAQPRAAFRMALNVELGRMTALHFSASAL